MQVFEVSNTMREFQGCYLTTLRPRLDCVAPTKCENIQNTTYTLHTNAEKALKSQTLNQYRNAFRQRFAPQ